MLAYDKVSVTKEELLDIANYELTDYFLKNPTVKLVGLRKGAGTFLLELERPNAVVFDAGDCDVFAQSLYDRYMLKLG